MTSLLRYCDAKCHNASPHGKCGCRSCAGRLHGKGGRAKYVLARLLERERFPLGERFPLAERKHALNALADLGVQVGQPYLPGMETLR